MSLYKIILYICYSFLVILYRLDAYFTLKKFGQVDLSKSKFHLISTKINGHYNINEINNHFMNGSLLCFTVYLEVELSKEICLKLKHASVLSSRTQFHIFRKINGSSEKIDIEKMLVEGFITSEKMFSYVEGYIKSIYFYGKVKCFDVFYYIEDLNKYSSIQSRYNTSERNAIVFQKRGISSKTNEVISHPLEFFSREKTNFIKKRYSSDSKLFRSMIGKGKICTLLVVLDNSFITKVHDNDINSAIKHVLFSIDEADSLFRSTDFDNDGNTDNIGFLIKHFIILQTENSPMNLMPKYSEEAVEVKLYLKMFSRYSLLSEVCLGVAFTGQAFKNDIIGVSYSAVPTNRNYFQFSLGGICDRPFMNQPSVNLNTLVVSAVSEKGQSIPEYIFHLSLSHELGHSFGSDHDTTKDCIGHLMTDHTPDNLDREHFVFSKCSKRRILETIVSKGHCLEEYDHTYCGNGRIEPGEECDCGTSKDCQEYDACCIPRGRTKSCQIRRDRGFQCHPAQGMCCSLKCMYKDLSKYDLACKNFQNNCPCKNGLKSCSCGINGKCTENICSSEECTKLNLEECVCPKSLRKDSCRTCCLFKGSCMYSSILSKQLIEWDDSVISKFEFVEESEMKHSNFRFYERICKENQCAILSFRKAMIGDYCLLFGKLGICDRSYRCVVPDSKLVYPIVPVEKMKRSGIMPNFEDCLGFVKIMSGLLFCYSKIIM